MIYNLAAYIESKLPSLVTVYDDFTASSPEDCTLIKETGGVPSHYIDKEDRTVQCVSRYSDYRAAKSASTSIYDILRQQFHIELPAVTLDGIAYPAVKAWRILPMQVPTYIGTTENGKHLYSVNFIVTIK